ncbi:MAG: transporter substrate-binding domain-containing protein [Bacteroidales bacterium]|nr:transporter substrate-binding domain-containing protein [Candidatus Physcocola equi]
MNCKTTYTKNIEKSSAERTASGPMPVFPTKLFLHICLLAILFLQASCGKGPRHWDEIEKDGKLNVAMTYNELGVYHDLTEDSVTGIQYKMVNDLCDTYGLEANICIESDLEKCIDGLNDGTYDLVARLTPITREMKEKMEFTHSICLDKQVLVQRKKGAQTADSSRITEHIKSQLELAGHCISVPQNSPYINRLKHLSQEIGDTINIDEVNCYQTEQLVTLVALGDLDYTVCSQQMAKRLKEKYPQLDCDVAISFSQLQAWGTHKPQSNDHDTTLLLKINEWIDANANKYWY